MTTSATAPPPCLPLSVLDGSVIGRCMQRHRHQEFIRFLNAVEHEVPAAKSGPRGSRQLRHPQAPQEPALAKAGVTAWLKRHQRFTFHFTPTSCSWANAVEGWFAKLSRQRL